MGSLSTCLLMRNIEQVDKGTKMYTQNKDLHFFCHPSGSCTNPYGTTKYAVEKMMMDLAASSDKWSVTLLRS